MAFNKQSSVKCMFCAGHMRLQHMNVFHPFKHDHGPFDIYVCNTCASCQTDPLPSRDSLEALYGSYRDGLPDLHRNITEDDPQTSLYLKCIKRICSLSNRHAQDKFSWLDVGAGGGELSALMAKQFPHSNGTAIDLHSRPASIANMPIEWQQIDINHENFAAGLPQFNLIVSIAVLEHVLRPDLFVANLLKLLHPGGMIYLLCPNNASWASRILRRKWPYFTPGEHLSIPTPFGAKQCLQREWNSLQKTDEHVNIHARPLMLPYTLRYVMRRLGANSAGRMLPVGFSLPLPVGALETTFIWTKQDKDV